MKSLPKILLPLALVAVTVLIVKGLGALAPETASAPPAPPPVSVEITTVTAADRPAIVQGTGTVQPATQIDLVPQVSGRVVWVAPGLTPGARFTAGAEIARIDDRDFQLALAQAEGTLASAKLELAVEEARGGSAQRETELTGIGGDNPLALRAPHLEAARRRVAAAEASVQQAKLALERTHLFAPFDAVVSTESLDVGQLVAPGAPVARLLGTDRFRVRVSVPVHQLGWLDVPGLNAKEGSPAKVAQALGDGGRIEREGFVLRSLGELDAETRTAVVLVALDHPLDGDGLPILPGAYVDVTLQGHAVTKVWEVPREAVQEGAWVWVADAEDRLARKEVRIGWSGPETVYVTEGLADGDRVVTSPMALPVVGQAVQAQAAAPRPDGA